MGFLDSEIDIFELDISLNWFTKIIQKTAFEKKLSFGFQNIPIRILGLIAHRVHLGARAIEKADRVPVPVVELASRPRPVEDDVFSRPEDGAPADAACR